MNTQNINPQNKALADYCTDLSGAVQEAEAWLTDNESFVSDRLPSIMENLGKLRRQLKITQPAATDKMCVAVFGGSQTGKSFLVNSMCGAGYIKMLGQDNVNFLNEINPEGSGNKESTGLVTRFTMDNPPLATKEFPVHIRLLLELDLVCIFVNTYYKDAEPSELNKDKLKNAIRVLEGKKHSEKQASFDHDDMEGLKEYIEQLFPPDRKNAFRGAWWETIINIAPFLRRPERVELFSLLWDEQSKFRDLFDILSADLERLGNPTTGVYCSFEALKRDKSIIDVSTLNNLLSDFSDELEIVSYKDQKMSSPVRLRRAVVAALTAELTLTLCEQPAKFFDHTDLLDFPGYLPRLTETDIDKKLEKEGELELFFRRGKVAYLFERYCARQELTSLLLCVKPTDFSDHTLPKVLRKWIHETHGDTSNERSEKLSTLFMIFTMSDETAFSQQDGQPVSSVWATRLKSTFDHYNRAVQNEDSWIKNWEPNQPFNNCYIMRNPSVQKIVARFIEYEDLKESKSKKEKDFLSGTEGFLKEREEAFLNTPLVTDHFKAPRKLWSGFLALNDGGVGNIRDALNTLLNDPILKRNHLCTKLRPVRNRFFQAMDAFWEKDSPDELLPEKEKLAIRLMAGIQNLAKKKHMGMFLRSIMLRDNEIRDLYFETIHRANAPADAPEEATATTVTPGDSAFDGLITDLFDEEDMKEIKETVTVTEVVDDIQMFRKRIIVHWVTCLQKMKEDPNSKAMFGIQDDDLNMLVNEMYKGINRCNIGQKLEDALREAAAFVIPDREAMAWKQGSLAASIINDYVTWLGLNPQASPEERTIKFKDKDFQLFDQPAPVTGLPPLEELPSKYNSIYIQGWALALHRLILDNAKNPGDGLLSLEENVRLGKIVPRLGQKFCEEKP